MCQSNMDADLICILSQKVTGHAIHQSASGGCSLENSRKQEDIREEHVHIMRMKFIDVYLQIG